MQRLAVTNLGKSFSKSSRIGSAQTVRESILEIARSWIQGSCSDGVDADFWALRNISFAVEDGEVVAILGRNGAGKTTLLRILSEIIEPTEGEIILEGRVGHLLGANTGFHEELTGQENVHLVGAMMGFSRTQLNECFDNIIDFAEVRAFKDLAVKHYSTGMLMKLGFSLAVHLLPEILILDEVLSVGDLEFQKKAIRRTREITGNKRAILFVSHNLEAVRSICNRALVLEKGGCLYFGEVEEGIRRYLALLEQASSQALQKSELRRGRGEVRLAKARIKSARGDSVQPLEDGILTIDVIFPRGDTLNALDVTVDLLDATGNLLCTLQAEMKNPVNTERGREGAFECRLQKIPLGSGIYELNIRIDSDDGLQDYVEGALHFQVAAIEGKGSGNLRIADPGRIVLAQDWRYKGGDLNRG